MFFPPLFTPCHCPWRKQAQTIRIQLSEASKTGFGGVGGNSSCTPPPPQIARYVLANPPPLCDSQRFSPFLPANSCICRAQKIGSVTSNPSPYARPCSDWRCTRLEIPEKTLGLQGCDHQSQRFTRTRSYCDFCRQNFIEFFRGRPRGGDNFTSLSKCSRPFIQSVKSTPSDLKSCNPIGGTPSSTAWELRFRTPYLGNYIFVPGLAGGHVFIFCRSPWSIWFSWNNNQRRRNDDKK